MISFTMTQNDDGTFDFRLENNSSLILSGPSKAGKSVFTMQLLERRDSMFREPTGHIYWFYGIESPDIHFKLKEMGVHLIKGLPQEEDIAKIKKRDIIVLDDLQQESAQDKDITNLFIRGCHHQHYFVIKLTQYLYGGHEQRVQNSNAHYYAIFNDPHNQQQRIRFLSRMFPPQNNTMLTRILNDVHRIKYSYLFIDFTTNCEPDLRLRTDIFGDFVVFKLTKGGLGPKMDYSRIALNPGRAQQGGGMDEAEIERRVQRYMSPNQGHVEKLARRLITTPPVRTVAEANERARRMAAFNAIRARYFGLRPPSDASLLSNTMTPSMTTLSPSMITKTKKTIEKLPRKKRRRITSDSLTPLTSSTPRPSTSNKPSFISGRTRAGVKKRLPWNEY